MCTNEIVGRVFHMSKRSVFARKLIFITLICSLCLSVFAGTPLMAASAASASTGQTSAVTFTNPVIWSDVPDPSVIRVGDAFYMTSTTMHMSPGVPVMKSYDLVNWETVSYVYDVLADRDDMNLQNGRNAYAQGSWASCIRYHNGKFYVVFLANNTGKTYIYTSDNAEKGTWTRCAELSTGYHDPSLLFDDDGKVYLVYGSSSIMLIELNAELTDIQTGASKKAIISGTDVNTATGKSGYNVKAEGSHIYKINGKYYIFLISWPNSGKRMELCFRADSIDGPYEGKVVLDSDLTPRGDGVAQGGIVDTVDGQWYAMLFQDHGAIGRVPVLVPVLWDAGGWPVFGDASKKASYIASYPVSGHPEKSIVASDEFDESELPLEWQWNHNPDNGNWSLTENPGYLRLTTGSLSTNILNARNTLTQRTMGPVMVAETKVAIDGMKNGDVAGLTAFGGQYGYVGVKMVDGKMSLVMANNTVNNTKTSEVERAKTDVASGTKTVYLKALLDFSSSGSGNTDTVKFYYSLNGSDWVMIGVEHKMVFNWDRSTGGHFMGYRIGLFNYATQETGGYADFDYLKIAGGNDAPNLSTAASWAREGIQSAYAKGFIPADLQNSYNSTITRAEFCRMAVQWLEYATGKTIDTILSEKGVARDPNAFDDTKDEYILAAYALDITTGTVAPTASTPGKFTPNGSFSREQAAAMIRNVCKVYGAKVVDTPSQGFTDIGTASGWAVDGINFCYANRIMNGTSTSSLVFSPAQAYSREQSIVTFNNIKADKLPKP